MTPTDLAEARRTLGLTQRQLAALLEVAPTSVSQWERTRGAGLRNPPPRAAALIRAYLDGYRPDNWPSDTRAARAASTLQRAASAIIDMEEDGR